VALNKVPELQLAPMLDQSWYQKLVARGVCFVALEAPVLIAGVSYEVSSVVGNGMPGSIERM
jgi:hypothetical protein